MRLGNYIFSWDWLKNGGITNPNLRTLQIQFGKFSPSNRTYLILKFDRHNGRVSVTPPSRFAAVNIARGGGGE